MRLDVHVLGPLEVLRDGVPIVAIRPRERAVLALLVLGEGREIPTAALADDLWDGDPPASAASALRGYLSRLRQALGECGPSKGRSRTGYRLPREGIRLDADEFACLAEAGRAREAVGDSEGAAAQFAAALRLWRGPALPEVADLSCARAFVARLNEARLTVLEHRLECDLARGRHDDLASELAELTEHHPLREAFWTLRMRALYRAGRPAEALAAYQEMRRVLDRELGLEPGPAARSLEAAILRRDPSLEPVGCPRKEPIPLPPRLAGTGSTAFVGRRAELDRLAEELTAVSADGGRRVLLVGGEPGIGKTTLCAQFARLAHAGGVNVLYGRSDESLGLPYQSFAEALRHLVTHLPSSSIAAHVACHGGDIAGLVPEVAARVEVVPPPRSSDPATQRYLLFSAAVSLLCADERPVLLVLDDLHWADEPTLALLRYLVGSSVTGLLVVCTYRASELTPDDPLAAALTAIRRDDGVAAVDLGGLARGEVVDLVAATGGDRLDRRALAGVHADTGGNPFFVVELVRHLLEAGAGAGAVPDTVVSAVQHRVTRLGAEAERLLSTAAVLGREFDLDVLALAAPDAAAPLPLLRAACRAQLLSEISPGRFGFAHAVVQAALTESLGPTLLAAAHQVVAAALTQRHGEGPGPWAGEVAHHLLAAGGGRPDGSAVLPFVRWAAEAAMAALAPEEAVRWYRAALDLQGDQPDAAGRVDLMLALGAAQLMAGQPAHRDTLLAAADLAGRTGDKAGLVRAVLINSRGYAGSVGLVDQDKVRAARAALEVVGEGTAEHALVQAMLCSELVFAGDWEARRGMAEASLDVARRLGDPECFARASQLVYVATTVPETLDARRALSAEVVALFGEHPDPELRMWSHRWNLWSCGDAGDIDGVDRHLSPMLAAAAASGVPPHVWAGAFISCWRATLAADVAEAERLCTEARRLGAAAGQPETELMYTIQLTRIRRLQGRDPEALADTLNAMADAVPQLGSLRAEVALAWCDRGLPDRARALLEADLASGFAGIGWDFLWLGGHCVWAEVAVRVDHRAAAQVLYERLVPWPDQLSGVTGTWSDGIVAHHLGALATTLGRYDDAAVHLTDALGRHARLRAPYWIGRSYLEHARLYQARRAAGDPAAAEVARGRAARIAEEHNLMGLSCL